MICWIGVSVNPERARTMNRKTTLIIFTDLDGTLLNEADYAWTDATPALTALREHHIPLIFTTSKTRAEVERLQAAMDIRDPFICENGAAVFFPEGYRRFSIPHAVRQDRYRVLSRGVPYAELRRFVAEAGTRCGVLGFGDLSPQEIAGLTDLPLAEARLAKAREFSEPLIIENPEHVATFRKMAQARGFSLVRGGRFHHLSGGGQDKGHGVRLTAGVFRSNLGRAPLTIGLGDSENDAPLLDAVNIPVIIPHAGGGGIDGGFPSARRAAHPGSRGWNEAVLALLDEAGVIPIRGRGQDAGRRKWPHFLFDKEPL